MNLHKTESLSRGVIISVRPLVKSRLKGGHLGSWMATKGPSLNAAVRESMPLHLAVYNIGEPTLPHIIATIFVLRYHEGVIIIIIHILNSPP